MSLITAQKQLIFSIDQHVNRILYEENEEALLAALPDLMTDELKDLLHTSSDDEMEHYCHQCPGFYQFIKLLEALTYGISTGEIEVP